MSIVQRGTGIRNDTKKRKQKTFNQADVILAKGQGNYESLWKQGMHIFYSFLCKCELFTSRFDVPKLTGIIVEERD